MTGSDLTLWGVGTPRTMRAHWMLMEFGLDYEMRPIQSRTGEIMSCATKSRSDVCVEDEFWQSV